MRLFRKLFAEKILRFYEGTNAGIRYISNAPLIGRCVKENTFAENSKARLFVGIMAQLFMVLWEFIKKFAYVFILIYIPYVLIGLECPLIKANQELTIIYMFVTAWRVGENDWWQNKHYDKCEEVFDKYLTDTNASVAPWYIIDSGDKKWAELQVLETLCSGIHVALQNESLAVSILQNVFPLVKMPKLSEVELDKEISEEEYKRELRHLQKKLNALHYRLYRKKIPVVIAYEGWDAAGKGGNIKRIAGALDPRGYEVHPIASPEPHEKARHYLWRFWTRLPKTGHIAIFDRTWYGRVMVERLEGFCSTNDWQRAYNEINEFEKELSQWGAVIIKFWVQIDKDTQLERFTERQNTPEKQWKITDEDWRNRDKWDQYEEAVNEMLRKTSTEYAPWHILESVDKKYARIKALKIVIEELEKLSLFTIPSVPQFSCRA